MYLVYTKALWCMIINLVLFKNMENLQICGKVVRITEFLRFAQFSLDQQRGHFVYNNTVTVFLRKFNSCKLKQVTPVGCGDV